MIEELKNILKRDFNKRMIEATAFKTFEAWWDDQERKFKVRVPGVTFHVTFLDLALKGFVSRHCTRLLIASLLLFYLYYCYLLI